MFKLWCHSLKDDHTVVKNKLEQQGSMTLNLITVQHSEIIIFLKNTWSMIPFMSNLKARALL